MNNRPPHSLKKQLLVQNKLEERYCYIKTVIEFRYAMTVSPL